MEVVHVVEGDVVLRETLRLLLSAEGFDVRIYASAPAFLREVDSTVSGCVIADMFAPIATEIELLCEIEERRLNFPVIIMSDNDDAFGAAEAIKLGAVGLLKKPIEPNVLVAAIWEALGHGAT